MMQLRYGMNPHQAATVSGLEDHIRIMNGRPSYINLLDALNGWQLVREAAAATGQPTAASVKHVSPAGAAIAGQLDAAAMAAWGLAPGTGPLTSAYARARDADPRSSFGDMIAVSEPVDAELADLVRRVVADGIIAPDFAPGTAPTLAAKKGGAFLVLAADPGWEPPATERREIGGLLLEQERDAAPITTALLRDQSGAALPADAATDAMLGLVVARYTQSNSVALVRDGAVLGVGAGQQSRVGCVQVAAAKARAWWLRRHAAVADLPAVPGMSRQDRLNWQLRMAEAELTPRERAEFAAHFPAAGLDPASAAAWLDLLDGVTLVSDGYLPFRDNIDRARGAGVRFVVEPGGSARSADVAAACAEYGITLVRTGLRLFRH